jgi:hypothetical protein
MPETISVLTIQQPWLLFATRMGMDVLSRTPYGTFSRSIAGPCLLHASMTFDESWPYRLSRILTANCAAFLNRNKVATFGACQFHFGEIQAITTFGDSIQYSSSPWFSPTPGLIAIPMSRTERLAPWPHKGSMRILQIPIAEIPSDKNRSKILAYLRAANS